MDGGRGWWVVVVLLLVATVPGVGGGAVAAPATETTGPTTAGVATATAETAYLDHHVTLGETNDSVTVTMTLREVPGLESFSFDLPAEAAVQSTDGFEQRGGRWYWDGAGSAPSLVYELDVGEPGDPRVRGPDWAIVAHLGTHISWTESRDVDVERRYSGSGGYAGDDTVAVGDVTTRSFDGEGATSTVVVPTTIADRIDVEEVGNVTTDLARWMPAGEPQSRISVFVLPEGTAFGAQGLAVGGGDFLVASNLVDTEGEFSASILAHEYTHTRQSFATGEEMAWVTEGSARYYEHRYVFERRGRSFDHYRRYVNVEGESYADATLSEVHPTSSAAYEKGAHVLTSLDVLLRQRTDGDARVDDLLDRMNAHDGEVSYADFRSMVRAEAGSGLDGWLDLYVRGTGVPKLPRNASLVAPSGWESSDAPSNLYVCVGEEWQTRPVVLPEGEPVQVFDATYAVTRFSNATAVEGWDGPCDPDDLPVGYTKTGEVVPERYVFEGDTTITFRSAFDPSDVTTLDVTVVDQSTPTPSVTPTPTPTAVPTAVPATGTPSDATPTPAASAGGGGETTPTRTTVPSDARAAPEAPPLVVEPRGSGLFVRRGAVSALFPLPILVGMVGFLASIAGGTYLLLRE